MSFYNIFCSAFCVGNSKQKRTTKNASIHPQQVVSVITAKSQSPFHAEDRFVPFTQLTITSQHVEILKKYWEEVIVVQRKDIFHKTMLFSIEASPKLNEIIACQKYCVRDLTQWPKLHRICQAQFDFFHNLIFNLNCDPAAVEKEAIKLGKTHCEYAKYGLKPQFLDIWTQQFLNLAERLKIKDPEERKLFLDAWLNLISYIVEWMNYSYAKHMSEQRQKCPYQ
ncbi:hypothetical protein QR680_015963 [Steinernema hermaphroditum]|uniref:Globin family profile domain-containing protein n=1 Tax=Steinernema hermaphroditum TaxID=289476 RepID=A0AA39LL52_9BILA|nr:hypothetical protein QR680_015963 [Steinernema hermaphroditum]